MALINHSIPNLFNGVSQQPASLRHSSQAELQENAYSTVASGLRKRPPSVHNVKLTLPTGFGSSYTTHTISRNNTRHEVFLKSGNLALFDLANGSTKSVSAPQGFSYLYASNPETAFSLITVADYTFIINKEIKVAKGGLQVPFNPVNIGYVLVSNAPAQHTFTVTVDGKSASSSLGTEGGTIAKLATSLAGELSKTLGGSYSVTVVNQQVIQVVRLNGTALAIACSDTYGNQALVAISNGVARFSQLPSKFPSGYTFTVNGDPEENSDTYYVQYKNGKWQETVAPGSYNTLDPLTMPHRLIPQVDGTWLFAPCVWEARKVGDDKSNPMPSFIGRTINDIFFFRNRLGMLADENVIMSGSNQFFDFFAQSARASLDSDPIDVNTPGTSIAILRYAVPFNKVLLLFSDNVQFQLSAGDTLSPKTIRIDLATSFGSSNLCRPVAVGQELFFPVVKGNYTGFREYYVDNESVSNDAAEITAHVPHYVPGDVFKLTSSPNEDLLVALSRRERNAIYVYKFYWAKTEKMQSAWSKWTFGANDKIINVELVANKLYLLIEHPDGVYEEILDLQDEVVDDGMGFLVNLDRKVAVTGSYDLVSDTTTWILPYADSSPLQLVLGPAFSTQVGLLVQATRPANNKLQAPGNLTAGIVYVGKPYTMLYRFSEQYIQDERNAAILSATIKIRKMNLIYSNSGYFVVKVTPFARDTFSYPFTGKKIGYLSMKLGRSTIESGVFNVPIQTSNLGVIIDIINDSHLPSTFQSAEWEGELIVKSQRR